MKKKQQRDCPKLLLFCAYIFLCEIVNVNEKNVKCNDLINVKLKYIMGKGIGTIEANYY